MTPSPAAPVAPAVLVSQPAPGWQPAAHLRAPKLLQAALLLMVIANLGRIPVFSTGARDAPVLANDIFTLVFLTAAGLTMAHARSVKLDRVALYGLLFAGIGGCATLVAISKFGLTGFEVAVSLAYLGRWLFYFAIYIAAINVMQREDVLPVWRALETAVLLFAAFGIIQSIFLPDFAQLVYPESRRYVDWDPQGHRLVSTVLDPNFAGGVILSALMVHLAQMTGGVRVAAWKPLLLFVALVFTASRGSALAFVVGVAVVLAIRGVGKRLLKFGLVSIGLVAALSPWLLTYAREYNKLTLDASALGRLLMWARGLAVFADNPVIGVGMNTWGFVQERYGWIRLGAATYGIEGGLLFVAVMTGVVGLAAYLLMMGSAALNARAVWRSMEIPLEHRALAVGAAAFTGALIVHSMFTNSLFLPYIMEPLFVLWAFSRVIRESSVPTAR